MKACTVVVLCLAASPAAAIEGVYRGSGEGQLTATVVHAGGRDYEVELDTTTRGCGGSVKGTGTLRGNVLVVRGRTSAGDPLCVVSLEFQGRTVRMDEGEGCTFYHGAACGFSGTLRKR